ncbi:MAG: hypothetical protein Q8N88_00055 [Nanoarchaeota archaeon]|nr:hypothetical protein [Nanoarchaeota archaeon]
MEAIKKLVATFRIGIFFAFLPFLILLFKKNFIFGLVAIIIFFLITLFGLISLKEQKLNHNFIPLGYAIGLVLIFSLILMLFGTIGDLEKNHPIPLFGILAFFIVLIFTFFLFYYSHRARKEFRLRRKN